MAGGSERRMNIRKGRLTRREKAITLRDEKELKREANEVIRQTQKDLFNPARVTIRQMDQHEHEIDEQLAKLEKLRGNIREGHKEFHELNSKKAELKSWKKRLRMARKAKELGAKNEEISRAVRDGVHKHSHGPLKSILARLRHKRELKEAGR